MRGRGRARGWQGEEGRGEKGPDEAKEHRDNFNNVGSERWGGHCNHTEGVAPHTANISFSDGLCAPLARTQVSPCDSSRQPSHLIAVAPACACCLHGACWGHTRIVPPSPLPLDACGGSCLQIGHKGTKSAGGNRAKGDRDKGKG